MCVCVRTCMCVMYADLCACTSITFESTIMQSSCGCFSLHLFRLHLRHQEMQDQFEALCRREVVKPKWSRDLLNMRVQEEHLIKQRNFKVAAKVGFAHFAHPRCQFGAW